MRMRSIFICGRLGSTMFFTHYLIKGKIIEKNFIQHKMCVLIFSTNFVWKFCHCKKNLVRYDKKCTMIFMQSSRYGCQIVAKLEFFLQIFEKFSNINL